ncbi:MAG: SDR family oxidoreductase [Xanthobacteraceae bacterium]|jgi:3-oxoacyl-[acyl-carrier protein] reductase
MPLSPKPLDGRVAIVTGSSRRIGRATALALANAGAALVINASKGKLEAQAVADEIAAAGGQAVAILADVAQPDQAAALVQGAVEAFGRLDILINNAAVRRRVPLAEITHAEWRTVTGIILDGAFFCAQAAAPHLIQSGHGRIINIGGWANFAGAAQHAHVLAAKSGLVGLTKALAHELGPSGVTVNLLSPGLVETAEDDPKRVAERRVNFSLERIPLRRVGAPDDISQAVVSLAGDAMAYVTGAIIHVNGGLYMG